MTRRTNTKRASRGNGHGGELAAHGVLGYAACAQAPDRHGIRSERARVHDASHGERPRGEATVHVASGAVVAKLVTTVAEVPYAS